MADIPPLLSLLEEKKAPQELAQSLRSDAARSALLKFHTLLRAGTEKGANGKLGFDSWSRDQIGAVVSAAKLIVTKSFSMAAEQMDPPLVVIMQESLLLSTLLLENGKFDSEEFRVENDVADLLEVALLGAVSESCTSSYHETSQNFSQVFPVVPEDQAFISVLKEDCSNMQGFSSLEDKDPGGQFLIDLASDYMRPVNQETFHPFLQVSRSMISLAQHWAVLHLKFPQRMLLNSKEILCHPKPSEELTKNCNFQLRISFSLRILKMLGNLAKQTPYLSSDMELLNSLMHYTNNVLALFRHEIDFFNHDLFAGSDGVDSHIILLLEEVIEFVRIVFSDGCIVQNFQTCIAASIMDTLDINDWHYSRQSSSLKPPFAYWSKAMIFFLKLIGNIYSRNTQSFDWMDKLDMGHSGHSSSEANGFWDISSRKIYLHKKYNLDEHLRFIFLPSKCWVDNLVHVTFFLHSEGVKLKLKVDKLHQCHTKDITGVDTDSAFNHEDDALFGDLFSEATRPLGQSDIISDHPAITSVSNSHCMLIHAAYESLNFLKMCIFNPDWSRNLFDDACRKLNETQISSFITMLHCHACLLEEKQENVSVSLLQRTSGTINEACFELLHSLIVHRALSFELEDFLVEQILRIENGRNIYNDWGLSLLAHTLMSRTGVPFNQLTSKIFNFFVNFILDKANNIWSDCLDVRETLVTLPSVFHLEVLLMAFHSSGQPEKYTLARSLLHSIKSLNPPPSVYSTRQLSSWSLLVSRFVLLMQHILLYPTACPSWLLTHFRSELKEVPYRMPSSHSSIFASWTSITIQNIMSDCIRELPCINSLLLQLVDFGVSFTTCQNFTNFQRFVVNCDELLDPLFQILKLWEGKKAEILEDLIIERYVHVLCWNIASVFSYAGHGPQIEWGGLSLDTKSFVQFGQFLLNNDPFTYHDVDLSGAILDLLGLLRSSWAGTNMMEPSWDFVRQSSWLSLVVSLLQVSLWGYALKTNVHGVKCYWSDLSAWDKHFLNNSGNLIEKVFDRNQFEILVSILSSCLKMCLQAFEKAFLGAFDHGKSSGNGFSPLLLLKHVGFDKCNKGELLQICGCSSSQLDTVFCLISKLDSYSKQGDVGDQRNRVPHALILRAMLHGFPSSSNVSSAALASSVLNIQSIVYALDGLIKCRFDPVNLNVEAGVVQELLSCLMALKEDKCFQAVHENCDALYSKLCGSLSESSDYGYLFQLKSVEDFLKNVSGKDLEDSGINETLISVYIDLVENLRRDPLKADVFNLFLDTGNPPRKVKELFGDQQGDLLVLLNSLDRCCSESVNVKVLNFFVDLFGGSTLYTVLKTKILHKFLEMDLSSLSQWIEARLLGTPSESPGSSSSKGNSLLRESTMNFVTCLVSEDCGNYSREFHSHLTEAMLMCLDNAFVSYDIYTSKTYFNFVVQILNGKPSFKQLLERVIMLARKLAGNEGLLQGLKFLFGFLGSVLRDCGASKTVLDKLSGKYNQCSTLSASSLISSPVGSRKSSDSLVLPSSQGSASGPTEFDATSAEEDEDDGTSDGELASIDKEEEEDSNSERALASKVCTFTSSGSNFMEQHWYFCYTCDLTVSKGCCSVCAKVCHRGHRVVYSRSSRFFCDCGAGGVRGSTCQCLKPRKYVSSNGAPAHTASNLQSFLPYSEDGEQAPDSDSDLDEDLYIDGDNSFKLSVPKELQEGLAVLLEELGMEGQMLELCDRLLPSVVNKRDMNISKDKKIMLNDDKVLTYKSDMFQLKKSYKSGSFDLKIRADYSNSRELKSHLTSGSLMKSLLSVSGRGRLAAGEGDKVAIFDVGQLIGQLSAAAVTADKSNIKPLSRNIMRFEIVQLMFNPVMENYLVVAGYEECQVLTVNPRGEVTDRLAVELASQGAYIRRVEWVPGSQVQLLVVTNIFVKIYDLSQDNISPLHYFTLEDDSIVDATLVGLPMGRLFLFVLSESGHLFRLELSLEGDVGAKPLKEVVEVPRRISNSKGLSLYFSSSYRLLFLSYQDGATLVGRLDSNANAFSEMSAIFENDLDGQRKPAALHHWKELLIDGGIFVSFSSLKLNSAFSVFMGQCELYAQNMRNPTSSTPSLVGIAAYKALSKDKAHCLVLYDDGSLQVYLHTPAGVNCPPSTGSNGAKKLGAGILSNKVYASTNPEFPLDFFEKTICITSDVKLSCEVIKGGDSDSMKLKLASDDGFLESPSPSGFKITVSNSNLNIVMVGIRVHVGNTSPIHIPSNITIFHRVIKLDEGMRSWYDIPFTVAESLLADEEFVISVGSTFDASTLPRIDSLEIYGQSKDEFGWKEKMDAIMDMADVLGSNSGPVGTRKKNRNVKASSIQEQLLADALNILAKLYSLCNTRTCIDAEQANLDLQTLSCKNVLEKIFESDREPLLQAAACHVLQAIFPKKEIYYHMKDTMRLFGVMNSSPILSSRIGVGGIAAAWVIKEFIAKTRAVSKIAMLRSSNMATFIKDNGPGVIDGLMQVLWEILDLEQPDTQTINNIVIPSVELIYSYAECLAFHGSDTSRSSVAPAVKLLKKLLFAPYESVQMSSSLAISSRLLQVPFPKQTILTSDETLENSAAARPRSDVGSATSGNMQAVIEEDSTASSVQYCCDGCSTVPILRRRWHCNVCPDFDLCEACYEVMDADRLPPPHSRDHPMSAIPIDIDSIGDCGEIQFSMDELNEGGLMHVTSDVRMQTSAPVHVTEPSETGDFPVVDQRVVSISASKRAVNTLLLLQLIDELKGWMETTSGMRAIPIMQLFYRLSSAVGGPFTDGSKAENLDLENFIRWFLDQINLNKPFSARTRSYFGEISILVYMFLTLMLRNWHHPANDGSQQKSAGPADTPDKCYINVSSSSPAASANESHDKNEFASQLIRACSYLRQQSLVNYLMDILQQLVGHFKSSPTNADGYQYLPSNSGCGSLLTIRRELPAGNYSPFFSDSYAKAHRSDLFFEYHKLLLENTFRLVYSLVRPEKQDKSVDKEKIYKTSSSKDLKLDGYQDVLCYYISNPQTSFVRRYARRLFLHLCGSKTNYYSIRDSWQFTNEVKRLYKLINKSGGFQNPVSYERSVKLVKCLSTIAEVAGARPRNWQKYCSKHSDVLTFLMEGIFNFDEESVIRILKLLNFSLYPGKDIIATIPKPESGDSGTSSSKPGSHPVDSKRKKKGDDGSETNNDKSVLDMEHAVEILFKKENCLKHFIDTFLLDWNSTTVRVEAKCILYGAWYHGRRSFKEALATVLLQKIKYLPLYGQNILEYSELLTMILGKVSDNTKLQERELITKCLTADVLSCIFETLHSQNELLANHPNSRIYNTLSSLVEFDGYYLESEPCVACSCPEVPYTKMKLESLKFETKFTDNRIIVKCTGSYTIQSVSMNVHDARKSKSVKVLNLYYNNRPVSDLSELKNNWSLWKRAKSCHLAFNQTELKVEFAIPITACNFMIELDSFYENLQASSLESLQCPRCSRPVTDKHGICGNCHENAYQCRQCRNINYENLDSFLCNECGYSKYGRFEFNFMARPSFLFDSMENDEDMKKGLVAIESESENAHRRYQQLMGFKKPLLKLVSNIGEHEIDSQQKDSVQQMMASLPGPSCKINRKIALLGVLYGEKCKAAFDSVSKSVQTLQGLRRVLMSYLQQKNSGRVPYLTRFTIPRSRNNCYGCATAFVTQCMELILVLSKYPNCKKQLVASGILSELFENNLHQGPKTSRVQARAVLCAFTEGDSNALSELNNLIQRKVMYCLDHHRSMDIASATREELLLLSETCAIVDELWEARLRIVFHLLFASIKRGAKHPAISEHIILPCLRIISQACTPPKSDIGDKDQGTRKPDTFKNDDSKNSLHAINGHGIESKAGSDLSDKFWDGSQRGQDIQLVSYSEWERGASYLDFVRRQYKISQAVKSSQRSRQSQQRSDYLALKYGLIWKRACCKRTAKSDFSTFELGSWVSELILSSCSQSIRVEVSNLISLLCPQMSIRQFQLLNLLMMLLPATLSAGESAAEYFELFFKVIDSETARLFLTAKGCLTTVCRLITQEVSSIESQERSLNIDISQGFILHKLVELLSKFLEVSNIRQRFMRDELLSDVLESLVIVRGLIVQKTKIINDCHKLLRDLLDCLLLESNENKRQFIRACISGLQTHEKEKKGRNRLFILEQLRNIICPSKPEPVYHLILNKAHTQEEFIRGSMTKNPYSSTEVGPLMRDVKNKICHQLDLLGLLEDDYGMELLVAGNIISLDLSISQVYEQVWKKSQSQMQNALANAALLSSGSSASGRDFPPMTVTYRLQGLDGEATEPMIKELEEEREEYLDPEVEFAIAGSVREFGGLEIILRMIQMLREDDLKSNQEELASVLSLLMYCCKICENRRALLHLGALGLLLDTARRAFSVDAMEPAEGVLLIVESLTMEANESDFGITQSVLAVEETVAGEQAKRIVLMFLERLCHPSGIKKSNKQQRNNEMVARILPYLTYGEPAAMDALIQHFIPYLLDWVAFDRMQRAYQDSPNDENLAQQAGMHQSEVENFIRVSESLKTSSCGDKLKDIILEKGITVAAVKHLKQSFALSSTAGFKSNPEWLNNLKLPSIPLILAMLRGLSRGHMATQRYIDDEGTLSLLHSLEGVSGENEIGVRAENLLDTLCDKEKIGDGFLGEKIDQLRHATRNEMRQRALRKREELLQGLGMRQELASDGGERIIVSQPAIEGLDDVEEEEDGLACMVCREGYTLRPNDMLGVYAFSKRVNLGASSSGNSRGDCVYTTVSHFNIIHFQCHQEAKRADAALKNPKKEWEGATLRNNETLCNCIFPLRGPSVPLAQYIRCVDQYWDNLSSLGRADGSRLRLLTYDIVLMLARFATGASFSADSKGGGRESNSRLLPFMIQMACHLVDQGTAGQQRRSMAKTISAYLSSSSPSDSPTRPLVSGRPSIGSSDETVQFMMVNSLLAESYEEWSQHLLPFLQRGIYHAYMQHTHGRSSSRLSSDLTTSVLRTNDSDVSASHLTDSSKIFPIIQPMLVYAGLIEQLQRFFKLSRSSSSGVAGTSTEAEKGGGNATGLEKWEILMRERLLNMKEMLNFAKELLSWLEDMTTSTDIQEALDVMGTLGAVLSGGYIKCEDFVQAAITLGKS